MPRGIHVSIAVLVRSAGVPRSTVVCPTFSLLGTLALAASLAPARDASIAIEHVATGTFQNVGHLVLAVDIGRGTVARFVRAGLLALAEILVLHLLARQLFRALRLVAFALRILGNGRRYFEAFGGQDASAGMRSQIPVQADAARSARLLLPAAGVRIVARRLTISLALAESLVRKRALLLALRRRSTFVIVAIVAAVIRIQVTFR